MAEIKELQSLTTPKGVYNSFPDLTARTEIEELKKNGTGNGSGQNVTVEPADGDTPRVFITGKKPITKDYVLAEMVYISKGKIFKVYLKIKCQGTSSLAYDKKNFTVTMYADEARTIPFYMVFKDWGVASNKFVLKANYIDHSHARNIVAANLWAEVVASHPDYDSLPEELRNSPNNGAVDGFPVKLYYNGTYEGLYTWNIGKDAWMWGMDEDNANHALLCGELNTDGTYAETACNFRALWSGTDGDNWSVEVGANSDALKASLNNLIQFVMDNDGESFKTGIDTYLDVQSAIDYYIFQHVNCGLDNLAKNMLLATYDGIKWRCGAYDLDATFGLWWDGTSFVSTKYACPEDYQEKFSLLWERIATNFADELKSRYFELRETVLSYGNIVSKFERFMDAIGKDLYAEDLEVYPAIPSGDTNNIKQIRNFVRDRLTYVDTVMQGMDGFTVLNYIASDGNAYIDTGISGGANAAYELLCHHTPDEYELQDYDHLLAGATDGAPKVQFYSWNGFHVVADGFATSHSGTKDTQDIDLGIRYNSDGSVYTKWGLEDWALVTPDTGDASVVAGRGWGSLPWYVFNSPVEPATIISMQLYYLKMYTDGVLVRDFIPVQRDSDGAIGLWDKVSGAFFENIGTGAFWGA